MHPRSTPRRTVRAVGPRADCVAPPSDIPDILGRRALSAGRLAALGATPDFHHGLLRPARAVAALSLPSVASELSRQYHNAGTGLDALAGMDISKDMPTVEQSLEVLSEAIGKATEDLSTVRTRLDQERFEIASRNTSISRGVVRHAERVVDHLRQADDELRQVLKDLTERE